ncbi:MAG: N-acetyltransferase family protein [Vicinamibacterales bacterium]
MAEVRRASTADVPTLVDLMGEFYAEAGFPLDRGWAAAAFTTLLDDESRGAVWVVDCDGEAAGHAVLSVRFAMEFGGLAGYIDDLFVRPPFRRRGAARAAVDALVAECRRRGCHALHVEVDPANEPAVRLYQAYGLAPPADGRQEFRGLLTPGG